MFAAARAVILTTDCFLNAQAAKRSQQSTNIASGVRRLEFIVVAAQRRWLCTSLLRWISAQSARARAVAGAEKRQCFLQLRANARQMDRLQEALQNSQTRIATHAAELKRCKAMGRAAAQKLKTTPGNMTTAITHGNGEDAKLHARIGELAEELEVLKRQCREEVDALTRDKEQLDSMLAQSQ